MRKRRLALLGLLSLSLSTSAIAYATNDRFVSMGTFTDVWSNTDSVFVASDFDLVDATLDDAEYQVDIVCTPIEEVVTNGAEQIDFVSKSLDSIYNKLIDNNSITVNTAHSVESIDKCTESADWCANGITNGLGTVDPSYVLQGKTYSRNSNAFAFTVGTMPDLSDLATVTSLVGTGTNSSYLYLTNTLNGFLTTNQVYKSQLSSSHYKHTHTGQTGNCYKPVLHSHTSSCYHSHSDYDNKGGCYHTHTGSASSGGGCYGTKTTGKCTGKMYEYKGYTTDGGGPYTAYYMCDSCGKWEDCNPDNDLVGHYQTDSYKSCTNNITVYKRNCGLEKGDLVCTQSTTTPICGDTGKVEGYTLTCTLTNGGTYGYSIE